MKTLFRDPIALKRLEALALALKTDNPALVVGIDSGAVWVSDGVKDWGIYSLYIGSDIPVQVLENGRTVLHRASSARKPDWREVELPEVRR